MPYNNTAIFLQNSQANILSYYSENITINFRLDIPKECSGGELNESYINITGTETSSGYSASKNIPLKLKKTPVNITPLNKTIINEVNIAL